jgi:CheY-like chemotaxis protein
MDFQVVEAEDGEKALEVCKHELPEAILLDWNMPVMDGYEFLGSLRRMPGGDAPKVVFCTTENGMDHIARAGCRRQRIHHEAVRQGHRRGQVPGSRFDRGTGIVRFCL